MKKLLMILVAMGMNFLQGAMDSKESDSSWPEAAGASAGMTVFGHHAAKLPSPAEVRAFVCDKLMASPGPGLIRDLAVLVIDYAKGDVWRWIRAFKRHDRIYSMSGRTDGKLAMTCNDGVHLVLSVDGERINPVHRWQHLQKKNCSKTIMLANGNAAVCIDGQWNVLDTAKGAVRLARMPNNAASGRGVVHFTDEGDIRHQAGDEKEVAGIVTLPGNIEIRGYADGVLKILGDKEPQLCPIRKGLTAMLGLPDEKLALGYNDGVIQILDGRNRNILFEFIPSRHSNYPASFYHIAALAVLPNDMLAVGYENGRLEIWQNMGLGGVDDSLARMFGAMTLQSAQPQAAAVENAAEPKAAEKKKRNRRSKKKRAPFPFPDLGD